MHGGNPAVDGDRSGQPGFSKKPHSPIDRHAAAYSSAFTPGGASRKHWPSSWKCCALRHGVFATFVRRFAVHPPVFTIPFIRRPICSGVS